MSVLTCCFSHELYSTRLTKNEARGKHPDPANFVSRFFNQKLLPVCPNSPASEEEEKEDELDVLAREFSESVAIQQTFVGGQLHAKRLTSRKTTCQICQMEMTWAAYEIFENLSQEGITEDPSEGCDLSFELHFAIQS